MERELVIIPDDVVRMLRKQNVFKMISKIMFWIAGFVIVASIMSLLGNNFNTAIVAFILGALAVAEGTVCQAISVVETAKIVYFGHNPETKYMRYR